MQDEQNLYPKVNIEDVIISKIENKPTMKNNTTDYKSFHYLENGRVDFSILNTKYTREKLDSGLYDIRSILDGHNVKTVLNVSDQKENFNSELHFYFEDRIESVYNAFFSADIKDKVNSLGYNHKLGLLLYGKQGTGKTSMLKKYFKKSN